MRILFTCVLALGGCGDRQAVPLSVKELGKGTIDAWFITEADPGYKVNFRLHPEAIPGGCAFLNNTTTARLNGSPPSDVFVGRVDPVEDEPYSTCEPPDFSFAQPLPDAPGAPDGEFVLDDGLDTIRLTVRNLVPGRELVRVTDPTTLKPGSPMNFGWLPGTDSIAQGSCWVSGPGLSTYSHSFAGRVEAGQLVADLPSDPWPAGSVLQVDVYATAPIVKCEGVKGCGMFYFELKDKMVVLPSL